MQKERAIVIGGSIAGLLTARVLSEHFQQVTVIERDTLPDAPDVRAGASQGNHLHALLARGQEIMEELLPGITDDLTQTGSPILRWGLNSLFLGVGGQMSRFDAGIVTNLTSRPSLEYLLRQRVQKIKNIEWITQTQVDRLIHEHGQITGVETVRRQSKEQGVLYADLIVDASGRTSKSIDWLQEIGYPVPEESYVNAFVGYATRWYEAPQGFDPEWKSIAIQTNVAGGNYRMGGLFQIEGNQYVLTLQGCNKVYPPTNDKDAFLEFAKNLEFPHLYEFIKIAKPISPIYGYRNTQNRIKHFERMSRRPENFIILGDACATFNPIYGQGMSVAATEVIALRDLLERYNGASLQGFATAFQKTIYQIIQNSWLMATAEDLRYPLTEGTKPNWMLRLMQRYSEWTTEILTHDPVVAKVFMDMMNLKVPGAALLHPRIVSRVFWHKFVRPKAPRSVESWTLDSMRAFTGLVGEELPEQVNHTQDLASAVGQ